MTAITSDPQIFQSVCKNIHKRSLNAKISAWLCIGLISSLAAFIIYAFSGFFLGGSTYYGSPSTYDPCDYADCSKDGKYLQLISQLKSELEEARKTKDQLEFQIKLAQLEVEKLKLQNEANTSNQTVFAITSSITRVGAVFIALYLMQILLSVMRYCFKTADHLSATANALTIALGNAEKTKTFLELISTASIDFGKAPQTPASQIGQIVDRTISKLAEMRSTKNNG